MCGRRFPEQEAACAANPTPRRLMLPVRGLVRRLSVERQVEGIKVKQVRRHYAVAFLSLLALLASLCTGLAPGGASRAGIRLVRLRADATAFVASKQDEHAEKISPDLLEVARDASARGERVRVILQTGDGASASLAALLRRRDVKTAGRL